jgi:hypothetical protein
MPLISSTVRTHTHTHTHTGTISGILGIWWMFAEWRWKLNFGYCFYFSSVIAAIIGWFCVFLPFYFFFFQYWGLNSRPTPWATPSALFFVIVFFWIGSRKLFAPAGFEQQSFWSLPPQVAKHYRCEPPVSGSSCVFEQCTGLTFLGRGAGVWKQALYSTLLWLFWRWSLMTSLPRLALNHDSPDLSH